MSGFDDLKQLVQTEQKAKEVVALWNTIGNNVVLDTEAMGKTGVFMDFCYRMTELKTLLAQGGHNEPQSHFPTAELQAEASETVAASEASDARTGDAQAARPRKSEGRNHEQGVPDVPGAPMEEVRRRTDP